VLGFGDRNRSFGVPGMCASHTQSATTLGPVLALSVLAACVGPVVMKVGQTSIDGLVIDRETEQPISGACVTEVLDKGGFWTQPSKYLIGSACSRQDGSFRIPANPRRVLNASEPESRPYFSVSAAGYRDSWFTPSPEAMSSGKVTISLMRISDKPTN
jgi:hypothetical protein